MDLKSAMEEVRAKMHDVMRPNKPVQDLAGRGNELRGGGVQPLESALAHMRAKMRNPWEGVKSVRPGND